MPARQAGLSATWSTCCGWCRSAAVARLGRTRLPQRHERCWRADPVRFEIRPLGTWIGPVTTNRAPARRFSAQWQSTLDLFDRETYHLGARMVVVQVNVIEADIRRDGMIRANAKVGFPGVRVSFDSR